MKAFLMMMIMVAGLYATETEIEYKCVAIEYYNSSSEYVKPTDRQKKSKRFNTNIIVSDSVFKEKLNILTMDTDYSESINGKNGMQIDRYGKYGVILKKGSKEVWRYFVQTGSITKFIYECEKI